MTREVTGYSSRRDAETRRRGKKEVLRIFQMKCFFVSLPYARASSNLPRRRATLYQLRWLSKGLHYRFADASRHATTTYTSQSIEDFWGAASPHETDVSSSDTEGNLSKSNVSYCKDGLPKLISKAYGIRVARRKKHFRHCNRLNGAKHRRNVSEALLPAIGVHIKIRKL